MLGAISQYTNEGGYRQNTDPLPFSSLALWKSADIRGFYLPHYFDQVPEHVSKLQKLVADGQLDVAMDNGCNTDTGPFKGIEKICEGLEVREDITFL
ncbi:hipothetical protein [Elysia marginata]|uniref:Hipothetical protein n=1 Tax=Elysia marginata TaxID=1093978 RepID=A0AAV4FIG2_9GAST|nr:hipothetical protein [Elysia marginata]